MEKKTIGKFIAVLRKANGMTQKELGDKLFVSDKTVSRWERDECTPELSLIPAIAEIFGITTDELLRGEKNNPEYMVAEEVKPSAKSEKQFKVMLRARIRKYKNLSLISVGLIAVGLIGATICDIVFNQGILGFCIATLFVISSAICQTCFASYARLPIDEDTEVYADVIKNENTSITRIAINVFHTIIIVCAFCLPLTIVGQPHFGLTFDSWIELGSKYALIAICIALAFHFLIVRRILIRYSLIYVSESEQKYARKLFKKVGLIALIIFAIIFISGVVFVTIGGGGVHLAKKVVLNTPEEFKAYMEQQYDDWASRGYPEYAGHTADGYSYNYPKNPPANYQKKYTSLLDKDGNVLCKYYTYQDLYYNIEYSEESDDKMPITVTTREAVWDAMLVYDLVIEILEALIVIDVSTCIAVYAYLVFKRKVK